MVDVPLTYSLGTVSVAADSTIVTGTGVLWTGINVRQWDVIQIDPANSNIVLPITSVDVDGLHLTIPAWKGGVKTNVPYVVYQTSPLRFVGGKAMADVDDMLAKLNTEGWYRYVNPIYASPTAQGIVANEGQFALKYTTGQLWIMTGGVWVLVGVYKGLSAKGVWNSGATYNSNDVVSLNGTSYLAVASSTNQSPPNTTYWQVLAAQGNTGPAALKPLVAWTTTTAYVTGPPADYVSINGSSYACAIAHTSGTFATDLAAGKWVVVAVKGTDAPVYGGTSTTSLVIATGSKVFTTQSGLAYLNGARVRASSAANTTNWMEGVITYSGPALTITVDKINGTGTFADWNFNLVGQPGAGDLSSANNLSELSNKPTARTNLGLGNSATLNVGTIASTVAAGDDARIVGAVRSDAAQSLSAAQQLQARTNIGSSVGVPDVIIEDQKTTGTAGGSATGGFQKRDLNTFVRNNGSIATLASSQITLPAGSYYFSWSAPGFRCDGNRTRLQNVTDAVTVGFGSSEYSSTLIAADTVQTSSVGSAVVTITSTKTFELQHRVFTAKTTNGFGVPVSFPSSTDPEIYSRVEITRFA